ncbi:MAG: SURF1 family cytochrome oxidase biogenesis protein [Rhodomicrobium sp.]
MKPRVSYRPIVQGVAVLCAFSLLVALGVWQLERREWKNSLIERFETGLSRPPVQYQPPATGNDATGREFMRVTLRGQFDNAGTIKVLSPAPEAARAKTREGYGYNLFTPLRFGNGIVFVDRGFVPASLAESKSLFAEGETEITGIVRLPGKASWFAPPNDTAKRLFFAPDIPSMAALDGISGKQAVSTEYIQAEPAAQAALWPQARDPHELLASIPNSHLEYALTWFALAAALLGVCIGYYAGLLDAKVKEA